MDSYARNIEDDNFTANLLSNATLLYCDLQFATLMSPELSHLLRNVPICLMPSIWRIRLDAEELDSILLYDTEFAIGSDGACLLAIVTINMQVEAPLHCRSRGQDRKSVV